jgi:hypothetical protein
MFYVLYQFVTYLLALPRIYRQMVGWLKNDKLESIWKEMVVTYSRYYAGIYLGDLTEITAGLIQNSRWPSKYSNRVLTEHVS